jgi:hypothetical protein
MSSNQTYNIARGLVRGTSGGSGARRILFTNNAYDNKGENRFVPGSGVGALNRSVRNHLLTRATPQRNIPTTPQCNCCATERDLASLSSARAIIFNCIDFRLRENTTCNLNCRGYYNNYDEIIAAGVSLGYNGLLNFTGWNTFIDSHIMLGHMLHNINEIHIVEHCQCGAYAANYGRDGITEPTLIETPTGRVMKYPKSGSYLVQEHEIELQRQNVELCAATLWDKFNGIVGPNIGTIRQISNLVIIGWRVSIDGCNLVEIYRRSS